MCTFYVGKAKIRAQKVQSNPRDVTIPPLLPGKIVERNFALFIAPTQWNSLCQDSCKSNLDIQSYLRDLFVFALFLRIM